MTKLPVKYAFRFDTETEARAFVQGIEWAVELIEDDFRYVDSISQLPEGRWLVVAGDDEDVVED